MKKLLVCILACAVLAGCGKADSSSEASSDTASPKESLSASAESKSEAPTESSEAPQISESEALAVSSEASKKCESEAPTEIVEPPLPSEQKGTEANPETGKPVIYLYPEKETRVSIKLNYPKDNLTYTYPEYNNEWEVLASPDGTLKNIADGRKYYYLFWEGDAAFPVKFDEGFSVKGSDTEKFLEEKLPLLGLNEKESNDFITYWAPKMHNNPYNLIKFAYEEYEELAGLEIIPAPDSMLRVHMVYTPMDKEAKIKEQELPHGFVRKGFTAIEWGGTCLNKLS